MAYSFRMRSVRAFTLWMQLVQCHTSRRSSQGDCILMQLPQHLSSGQEVSGHSPSGHSCHGTTHPDTAVKATSFGRSCYGILLPDEECQGIRLLDIAATAPYVQTQLSRWLHLDTAVMAYVFWMGSVRVFTFWTQLQGYHTSRHNCHSTENRSEYLQHIHILGEETSSSCIDYNIQLYTLPCRAPITST